MTKKCKTVVTMERFTAEYESDEILLRISGGGIAERREDDLYGVLTDIDGIDDVTVTRRYVGIEKYDDADWSAIVPVIKNALGKFFGKGVRIIERTSYQMPGNIGMLLGEANLDSMRDAMSGCALTEDECDALGIDFYQHHADLAGSY